MGWDMTLADRLAIWRSRGARVATLLHPLPPLPLAGDADRAEAILTEGRPPADPAFGWLDDLATLGDERAGRFAAAALTDWAAEPPRWSPGMTGWRLLRWLAHAQFLHPRGVPAEVMASLSRQAAYLARRWRAAHGWDRIAALAGLLAAAHALDPALHPGRTPPALPPLPRDPAELTRALALLVALRALSGPPVDEAIERAASALRTLRHMDGRLTGLTGGIAVDPPGLDAALVMAGTRAAPRPEVMGLARLVRGRASLLIDMTAPFAFELTFGRTPLVIAEGGARAALHLPGRTLRAARAGAISRGPMTFTAGHDGWRRLRHTRSLALSDDGRVLQGSDRLEPRRRAAGADAVLTFPLHPALRAETGPDGSILLTPPTGMPWRFAAEGAVLHPDGLIVLRRAIGRQPVQLDWTFRAAPDTTSPTQPPGA
ncbi:heparinase II/III family protein [Falsirhodobacter algicola]|uniref:Heparinase II/III-like C-terminal domain-containing protein n=1 Tax=Falsirhodobacter algicola TaxID=2692330 RepID=A0A8J8SL39_9RHOB|nr:heparinase II/III family protein [Falsirhodobacter algicola]QUS35999.1 hypothetical protein GR316_06810 [Falsirhodobacter algicola]